MKHFVFIALLSLITLYGASQNTFPSSGAVGIGTTAPTASSLLEVKSTTKGFLLPRMTSAQRSAISSPAQGLIVFQTDGTKGLYYYDGGWKVVTPSTSSFAAKSLNNLSTTTAVNQHLLPSISATKDLGSEAKQWKRAYLSNGISIGTTDTLAVLRIKNGAFTDAIRIQNTYQGPANIFGVYAYSIPQDGYGYGMWGYGGSIGVAGSAYGGASEYDAMGLRGYSEGTAGTRYGVFGRAYGATYNYGIYGYANAGIYNYAGYFAGTVYATSFTTTSDRKFKEDIQPIQAGLTQLLKLKPAAYKYKTGVYKDMGLPEGRQMGLIADEVKEVFPDLVRTIVQPAQYDKEDRTKVLSEEVKFEGVNYIGLIPVLVASVQELSAKNKEVDELKEKNKELERRIAKLESLMTGSAGASVSSAFLEGSTPNPANGSTLISYNIPEGTKTAHLLLTDMKGRVIKQILLTSRGNGRITLSTSALAAGSYTYSLHVDGNKADSKQLVVAR